MNNAEYLRMLKREREVAKMVEQEIKEALALEPEDLPDDSEAAEDEKIEEGTEDAEQSTESDRDNGDPEQDQRSEG